MIVTGKFFVSNDCDSQSVSWKFLESARKLSLYDRSIEVQTDTGLCKSEEAAKENFVRLLQELEERTRQNEKKLADLERKVDMMWDVRLICQEVSKQRIVS